MTVYKVQMLAFMDEGSIRNVWIPDSDGETLTGILENIFLYGQNDFIDRIPAEFRPVKCCSVSVGDVAEVNGEYYICKMIGWGKLTNAEFEEFKAIPQRDRGFNKFVV